MKTFKSNLKNPNRRGRPAKEENEKRTVTYSTRYNAEQAAAFKVNMGRAGFTNASDYTRQATLFPRIVPRLTEAEMFIARKLSGMSNNFNQLVRLCHQRGLDAMKSEVEYYLGQFRELFAKLNSN